MINKLIAILLFVGSNVYAQNSVAVNTTASNQLGVKTSYSKAKSKSKLKHPHDKYFNKKIEEYKIRMKANVKKHKKETRLMKKPQYSDPSYFGHKRKPKKRPPGKRKFCKECEIVH